MLQVLCSEPASGCLASFEMEVSPSASYLLSTLTRYKPLNAHAHTLQLNSWRERHIKWSGKASCFPAVSENQKGQSLDLDASARLP